MKKIIIWSDDSTSPQLVNELSSLLMRLGTTPQVQNSSELTENAEGYIYLKSNVSKVETTSLLNIFKQSKPLVAFLPCSHNIAQSLCEYSSLISVAGNENKEIKNIEVIECPSHDFITDRYTKLISSTIQAHQKSLTDKDQQGLLLICKELVEMC